MLLLHIERLRWFGHLTRKPPGHLLGEVFQACATGEREMWVSLLRLLTPQPGILLYSHMSVIRHHTSFVLDGRQVKGHVISNQTESKTYYYMHICFLMPMKVQCRSGSVKVATDARLQVFPHKIPDDDRGFSLSNADTVAMAAAPLI